MEGEGGGGGGGGGAERRLETLSRHLLAKIHHDDADDCRLLRHNHTSAVEEQSRPVVIGGMVLDIQAKPFTEAKPGTTAPGKVRYVKGGVARNVAECMSKLGVKPFLVSIVGLDMAGDLLFKHWKSSGLAVAGIRKCEGATTPIVSSIFDTNGELAAGVASADAVETFLTPEWIWQFKHHIHSAPILMIDANMTQCSLEAACQAAAELQIPVWFEPVSVTKSKRVASVAPYVTYTSPNEDELISMANALSHGNEFYSIEKLDKNGNRQSVEFLFQMLKPAICVLLEKGIKVIIVTLGSDGVLLCSREWSDFIQKTVKNKNACNFDQELFELVSSCCSADQLIGALDFKTGRSGPFALHFPALPASVVSLIGAGDCLVGGTLASLCVGLDITQSIAVGVAASKAAVETEYNIPPEYCLTRTADDAKEVFAAVRVLHND